MSIDEEHNFGDLFGSDDEASDIEDAASLSSREEAFADDNSSAALPAEADADSDVVDQGKRRQLKRASSFSHDNDNERSPSPDGLDQFSEEENTYENDDDNKQRVEIALEMPVLPLPKSDDDKYFLAKLPRFLDVDIKPFEADEFEIPLDEDLTESQKHELIRQQVQSTIRWRRGMDGHAAIESNAHVVEWEDGQTSLVIGNECFDISQKPMTKDEHVFLLAHQTTSGVLESHVQFTDHMTFRPSDLQSETHRHLTAQIADKHVRKIKTKMFYTEKDPEKVKQELELLESERLRAQKKLENQRRKAEERLMGIDSRSTRREYDYEEDVTDYEPRRRQDAYEEDFVVDDEEYDEEEERLREERLARAKGGRSGYARSNRYDDEEEEEEEAEENYDDEEEEEEEEEVVVRRQKRRKLLSDEEDE
ncbi:Paf1 complex component [Apophysomyces sp. BC1034]|nr:Paf1 complex component [Apophysomyces sp. BC1015]KAG0178129.1 Paf1 complex component [Apophysomyces sp. BC1021]KAG0187375.1 Paf1 complex component [Apophysomyces sp. BC1034]